MYLEKVYVIKTLILVRKLASVYVQFAYAVKCYTESLEQPDRRVLRRIMLQKKSTRKAMHTRSA